MAIRRPSPLRLALGVGLLSLAACAGGAPPGAPAEPTIERLSDGVYMVPVARDDRGCVIYRLRTNRPPPDRRFYWRVGEGQFSDDPDSARCA